MLAPLFQNLGGRQEKERVTVFFSCIRSSLCYGNQEDVNEFYWTYEKFITEATREEIVFIKESTVV